MNGIQKAQQNVDAFIAWSATQSDNDYKQIIFRGQLNRGEIAKAIGIGKSALRQNPEIKRLLDNLENDLRTRDILPSLTQKAEQQNSRTAEQRAYTLRCGGIPANSYGSSSGAS